MSYPRILVEGTLHKRTKYRVVQTEEETTEAYTREAQEARIIVEWSRTQDSMGNDTWSRAPSHISGNGLPPREHILQEAVIKLAGNNNE